MKRHGKHMPCLLFVLQSSHALHMKFNPLRGLLGIMNFKYGLCKGTQDIHQNDKAKSDHD